MGSDQGLSDPRFPVELKRSSWENIFRVLKWCAPMECSNLEGYLVQEGEHFSLGGFWAQVQEAQRQVDELVKIYEWAENARERLSTLDQRIYQPLPADHPAIGTGCSLCGEALQRGDITCLLPVEPASEEDAKRAQAGRAYNSRAEIVHAGCMPDSSTVEFVEEEESR